MNCFHSLTPNISLNSELNSHVNVINVNEPGLQQTIAEKSTQTVPLFKGCKCCQFQDFMKRLL